MGLPTVVTYHGVVVPLAVLARQHGHTPNRVRQRLRLGWTLAEALERPLSQSKIARAIEQYLALQGTNS